MAEAPLPTAAISGVLPGLAATLLAQQAIGFVGNQLIGRAMRRVGSETPPEIEGLDDLPELGDLELGSFLAPPQPIKDLLPDDLFDNIVGLERPKKLVRTALQSEQRPRMNVIFIGPPASGKSMFLEEVRRVPGSRWIVGRNMTSAGLRELFTLDEPPRILLIDEIEKSDNEVLGTLLTIMDGRLTEAVHGRTKEEDVDVRVIAAANDDRPIYPALLSRFQKVYLAPYTNKQRQQVIYGSLRSKDVPETRARHIARLVAPRSADVRDAERVAHIWESDPLLAKETALELGSSQEKRAADRARAKIRSR